MMNSFEKIVEEVNNHLACDNQNWLFGAGISCEANIPLMIPLTRRVENLLTDGNTETLYRIISEDLPDNYHIEHVLSHIGDYIAISERSKHKCVELQGNKYTIDDLNNLYTELIKNIGETIRYGYISPDKEKGIPEKVGSIENSIVDIKHHRNFVQTLLSIKSNLLTRSSITLFTTNYDTLLEDALILENQKVNDGFSGAAIGFWDPDNSFNDSKGINIVKLHGSVDWIKDDNDRLFRNRYGVNYFESPLNVLIYPQATKYVETQKDPFATLFTKFRERLNSNSDHILVTSGYSFGDNHINSEIEIALKSSSNKTILIVFIDDVNELLLSWLNNEIIAKKLFIATSSGIYHGSNLLYCKSGSPTMNWWKFSEFTKFLKDGEAL
jgi:NAD-dependent SIR2 family protein deacetylase